MRTPKLAAPAAIAALVVVLLSPALALASLPIHHRLNVQLTPVSGAISVTDTITFPKDIVTSPSGDVGFVLNARLPLDDNTPKPRFTGMAPITKADPLGRNHYLVKMPKDRVLTLSYSGTIARSGADPDAGIVSTDAVALSGRSHWYPQFGNRNVTFELTVSAPKDWRTISQGGRIDAKVTDTTATVTWKSERPQDEIHLVGGPLTEYTLPGSQPVAQVFLRTQNQALADRYLTATSRYVALYERMIGPYPYPKFALVENAWETGYGMPSFTLLGPTVVRLPFIPDTAYPHEILHSWWGNGVFVDAEGGNWSEGLTVYMADHYLKEQDGKGAEYRRDAIINFQNFVAKGHDISLVNFTSRHDRASQAVGYGKGMMLFHMLRKQLGDDDFYAGLREFYLTKRFTHAGYDDIAAALKHTSGRNLRPIFQQWTRRLGAPSLTLSKVQGKLTDKGHQLSFVVRQTQGSTYVLYLPLQITVAGQDKPLIRTVKMSRAVQRFVIDLPAAPTHLAVDPNFDLFRTIAPSAQPPTLSRLFGKNPIYVLPAAAPAKTVAAYRRLAKEWGASDTQMVLDRDLKTLPTGRALWLLGWDNRFASQAGAALAAQAAQSGNITGMLLDDGLVLPEGSYSRDGHAIALSLTDGARDNAPLGWLAGAPEQLPRLGQKLPHYGKYGYVVFAGDTVNNVLKGGWSAGPSPLSVDIGH